MASPAFATAGTYLVGATVATANVPVPAGVAAGDVLVVGIYKEIAIDITTIPVGFVEFIGSPALVSGTHLHNLHAFYKRATAADSGTYDFAWVGNAWREASCIRITGAISSGNVDDGTNSAVRTTTTAANTPAVSVTTTTADTLLVWLATNWSGGAWTPPTGMTERVDNGTDLSIATLAQTATGSSGSLSGACVNNGASAAFLAAIASGAATTPVGATSYGMWKVARDRSFNY